MEIKSGLLRRFDAGSYRATVEITGSVGGVLPGVPVARNISSSDMIAGRRVALLLFDPSNPNDMVVCAVWD